MNALKAEISVKRKTLESVSAPDGRPSKYLRKADRDRLREEAEKKLREETAAATAAAEEKEAAAAAAQLTAAVTSRSPAPSPLPSGSAPPSTRASPAPGTSVAAGASAADANFNLTPDEAVRRLRAKGQPIRLFGEGDRERRLRLRALELIEERDRGHERAGGQNDFRKALEEVESRERERKAQDGGPGAGAGTGGAGVTGAEGAPGAGTGTGEGKKRAQEAAGEVLDLGLIKTDKTRLYPLIYHALKRMLKEWQEAMDERPDHVKRTTQGRLAAATQSQSAEYLKPLFKLLRARDLPNDVLARMSEIVHYTQKRQYQRANDAYLRLSIGNAPWPIGVTMVGIHERSAREKISADQVAHVLNDEVSRKYIQSLKRLITFSQTKYPPEDVSQLMG